MLNDELPPVRRDRPVRGSPDTLDESGFALTVLRPSRVVVKFVAANASLNRPGVVRHDSSWILVSCLDARSGEVVLGEEIPKNGEFVWLMDCVLTF